MSNNKYKQIWNKQIEMIRNTKEYLQINLFYFSLVGNRIVSFLWATLKTINFNYFVIASIKNGQN